MNANFFVDSIDSMLRDTILTEAATEYLVDLRQAIIDSDKVLFKINNTEPVNYSTFAAPPSNCVYYEIVYVRPDVTEKTIPVYVCAYKVDEEDSGFIISILHKAEQKARVATIILYVYPTEESYNMSVIDVSTLKELAKEDTDDQLIADLFVLADHVMAANNFLSGQEEAYVVKVKEEFNQQRVENGLLPYFDAYLFDDIIL